MDGSRKTRDLYLWGMAVIYLFAFTSWFTQIPGLYGDDGILPVKNALAKHSKSSEDWIFGKPTIVPLLMYYGLSAQTSLEVLCLAGVLLSFLSLLFKGVRSTPVYLILWFLYYSFYQVGQTFAWFQWDILLLEAGFLTALVAPATPKGRKSSLQRIPFFLVKWLLFRLMFASGVVKLTSGCKTWWGLTALKYHFETQCIPTPLAWWAHQLPQWFLRLGVVGTYVIEIALPFLFFSPVRRLRYIAIYAQVFLMVTIILSGNYNFFNFLTAVLCLSGMDDNHLSLYGLAKAKITKKGGGVGSRNLRNIQKYSALLTTLVVIAGYFYYTMTFFGLEFRKKGDFIASKIKFTDSQFQDWVDDWTIAGIWIGAIFFIYEILYTIYLCLRNKGAAQKIWTLFKCMIIVGTSTYLFTISMVPFKTNSSDRRCWSIVHRWHESSRKFELVHSYGLFRSMTGVDGRPEVVLLGAKSETGPWQEIEFLYKPGNTSESLPWIIPHQPRLDWQMWFAALGQYQHNAWFVSLVDRLLNGNQNVIKLLDQQAYPFKKFPPRFIKADLYLYHFSLVTQSGSIPKRVWTRKHSRGYLPTVSKQHGDLQNFLKYHSLEIEVKKKKKTQSGRVEKLLQTVRKYSDMMPPHLMTWSLLSTAFIIMITKKIMKK